MLEVGTVVKFTPEGRRKRVRWWGWPDKDITIVSENIAPVWRQKYGLKEKVQYFRVTHKNGQHRYIYMFKDEYFVPEIKPIEDWE